MILILFPLLFYSRELISVLVPVTLTYVVLILATDNCKSRYYVFLFTTRFLRFLWPPYGIGQVIIFLPCGYFLLLLLSSIFFPRLISAAADWMSTVLPHMVWPNANLECRSEMCCTRLAGNTGRRKNRHFGTIAQVCRAMSSELRHVSTIGKSLLNSNTSSTCPDNMVNFGPLAAEIRWPVWGTPANFNGFRVLAALLHGTLLMDASQTLRR